MSHTGLMVRDARRGAPHHEERRRQTLVLRGHRADIGRTWPYQAAASLLLAGVRGPSRGAGDREDRRKSLPRDLQGIEQDRGEELHIGVERTVRFFPP